MECHNFKVLAMVQTYIGKAEKIDLWYGLRMNPYGLNFIYIVSCFVDKALCKMRKCMVGVVPRIY